ncbi:MAG: hypothetical protein M1822_005056 [Bathelium mastoideum]|nr:MAG: hypothetical protein M1822_005056 [Bathelium mastoideum]
MEKLIEELIAFFEYARAEGFEKAQINESAAQHLSFWGYNGQYSSDQIRHKLHRLRHAYGPEDDNSGDLDNIYVEGSNNLTWFNEGQQERIAKRTSEIRKEQELAHMYSPRKLRSGSKQITESPGLASTLRSESRSSIGFSGGNRGQYAAATHPLRPRLVADSLREVSQLVLSPCGSEGKADLQYETSPSISGSQESPVKAENTPSLFDTPARRTVVTVEVPQASVALAALNSTSTARKTLSTGSGSPGSSDSEEDREFDNRNLAALSATIQSMTERIEGLEKELHMLRRNSALDVHFWKTRCHTVELECAAFKSSEKALGVRLGELIRTGDRMTIDEIVQLQSTVDKLQSKLAHQIEVTRLARPGLHSLDNDKALWVADRMREAHRALEEAFVTRNADINWTLLMPHLGSLITPLVYRVVPTGTRSEAEIASALKLLRSQGITPKQFLQALSAAALVEWVFQASTAALTLDRYQGFCAPGTTSAYDKALAHIACKDPDFAKNIDLDIHRAIIGEEAFKDFLQARATDLGLRLQDAFESLWMEQDGADSTSESSDVEPSLGEQLEEVFRKIMEVQCELRVSGRRFRCTWYSSGQTIDPEHMTIYEQKHSDAEGQSCVSLTLFPGIDEMLDETSGVGMSGFVDGCSGREPAVCLIPAVVLCGPVPRN